MPDELTIHTGGQVLGGWQEVRVTRGVGRAPSDFEIAMTEPRAALPNVSIEAGATCEIRLGADTILHGYIDRYMPAYDKDRHETRLVGRSKTEDIVDSSVDTETLHAFFIVGGKVGEVAKRICAPYGIAVKLPDGDADLPLTAGGFAAYPGYTCYHLIEELARAVGMLVWDDADGNLVISRGGTGGRAGSALVEGVNIEAASATVGMDQRFQSYKVILQTPNDIDGHLNIWGIATDDGVKRPRLKLIPAEAPFSKEFAQLRADWERAWRFGQARQAHVTVTGWRDGVGRLWLPNSIVAVRAPHLKIVQDRVIAEASWVRGEHGTYTHLTLIEQQGLVPRPFLPIDPLPLDKTTAAAPAVPDAAIAGGP